MEPVPQATAALPPSEETHETTDVNVRRIAFFGGLLVVGLVVVFIAMTLLQYSVVGLPARLAQPPSYTTAPNVQLPPQPRFEEVPGRNLATLKAQQENLLGSYGWMDAKQGIVRIPITRAMELLVTRGFPVRPEDANNTFENAGNLKPSYPSSGRTMERVDP